MHLREHGAIALVASIALGLRLAVAVAYAPALFFSDSWTYVSLAYRSPLVGLAPDRPSGYPLILDAIGIPGQSLLAITTLQHVVGVVVGLLAYALLVRLGAARWMAALAAAVILLDSYAVTLEQHVMPETFFALLLISSASLTIVGRRRAWALGGAGVLLAAAVTLRTQALFAVPVWALYVLWTHHRSRRTLVLAALAVTLPLAAYSGVNAVRTGHLGMTQASGWFLYARVGEIGDCRGARIPLPARRLCDRSDLDRLRGAEYHLWDRRSPANRLFPGGRGDPRANRVLHDYAVAIIRDRPLAYAEMVIGDFLRYFRAGVASRGDSDLAITLPRQSRTAPPWLNERVRAAYFPTYAPPPVGVRSPLLGAYQDWVHVPRWALGPLVIATALALMLALSSRLRPKLPHRREAFLLVGMAVAMLLGLAATSEFVLRYLVPTVPLLLCGGALAASDLAGLWAARTKGLAQRGGIERSGDTTWPKRTEQPTASRRRPGSASAARGRAGRVEDSRR